MSFYVSVALVLRVIIGLFGEKMDLKQINQALPILGIIFILVYASHFDTAFAANVLTTNPITGVGSGVTSGVFETNAANLTGIPQLTGLGTDRDYISQSFTPTKKDTYIFGLSSSPTDTVLILYDTTFDPLNPGSGAKAINDDIDPPLTPGAPGVVMSTCGTTITRCPRLTQVLEANHTYNIVITTWQPKPTATVAFPLNFYVYGPPVIIGTQKLDTAKAALSSTLKIDNRQLLSNLMRTDDTYNHDAVSRHVASRNRNFSENNMNETEKSSIEFSSSGTKKALNMSGSLDATLEFNNNQKVIFSNDFSYVDRGVGGDASNANFRVGFERFRSMTSTVGAFFGMSISRSDFVSPYAGESLFVGGALGVYGVTTLFNDVQIASNATIGLNGGEIELNSESEKWKSEFNTELFSIGFLSTGQMSLKNMPGGSEINNFEIWPLISVQHGTAKSSNLISNFTFGSIFQNLTVKTTNIAITKVNLSPQFKFDLPSHRGLLGAKYLKIAPRYICKHVKTDVEKKSCGSGIHIDLSQKIDGIKTVDFKWEKIGREKTVSIAFNRRF